jgi:hypothetical protein
MDSFQITSCQVNLVLAIVFSLGKKACTTSAQRTVCGTHVCYELTSADILRLAGSLRLDSTRNLLAIVPLPAFFGQRAKLEIGLYRITVHQQLSDLSITVYSIDPN